MTKRTHVSLNEPFVEGKFNSWVQQMIQLISPKDLLLVAGRATGKTESIMAERSQDICYDMPGSYQILVADTYINALKNIVPTLLKGWERNGWHEGVHYVTDTRPPSHFKLPYKPPMSYKHTISVFNGCFFNIGSLDQPSGLAGGSYQHIYGDEARVLKSDKLKKITPAIRGEYAMFGHSPFYRGRTFTTDMPNIVLGDDDWILQHEKDMNIEQVKLALQVGIILNELRAQLVNATKQKDKKSIENIQKNIQRWTERWVRVRKDLTFFYVVSSFVNVDMLTDGYFSDSLKALGIEEFKSAILSFKIDIKKGEKFYGQLGEHHFYDDGIISSYYDSVLLTDDIEESSLALRYIDRNAPIDCGVDFGSMCSMVTAQERGNYLYCLKEFFTLAPESSQELGNKFRNFYKNHNTKILNMYYDRSGNQYAKVKRDWATEVKNAIMFLPDGSSSGWHVNLMSLDQSVITQEEEYNLAKHMMAGTAKGLPALKIDRFSCKHLKSSLELSKIIVKTDKKGSKSIHKDKSSEKLPIHLLPMFSTNFSDAFKYLIYRPQWSKLVSSVATFSGFAPEARK
jgi:hypothetical protein